MIKNSIIFHKFLALIGRIWWIRLGIRYRLILNTKYMDRPFTVDFFGYKYSGNLNEYIDRFVFYFGAYEKEELLFIKRYLNPNSRVLDIGANTGHHSMFFSRYSGEVYAFEPYKKMFDVLEKRISDNNIKNIKAFNFGIGESSGDFDFFAPTGKNAGVGSFSTNDKNQNIGKLPIKNGDDVVLGMGLTSLDFIKIDVEGMEVSVIKGLLKTIKQFKPVMFIEMGGEAQSFLQDELKSEFGSYNFYIIDANNPIFFFFNKPTCALRDFIPQKETKNVLCVPSN